jgi:hypothetical protein
MEDTMKEINQMTLAEITQMYYKECNEIALELAEEFNLTSPADYEALWDEGVKDGLFYETLAREIDSSLWTIYTYHAKLVGVVSRNEDAYYVITGELPSSPEQSASASMELDIADALNNPKFYDLTTEKQGA